MTVNTELIEHQQKWPRDPRMSALWIRPLSRWLADFVTGNSRGDQLRILDYGCGYFDLGKELIRLTEVETNSSRLAPAPRVDGFDPDTAALATTRTALAHAGTAPGLYHSPADLPRGAYDLIVVNSVLQYLDSDKDLADFFVTARALLKPTGRRIVVIADLIPPTYSAGIDALHSMAHATRHGLAVPMLRHLWQAATKPSGLSLLRIDRSRLERAARPAGFSIETLPKNLTPSPNRWSAIARLD